MQDEPFGGGLAQVIEQIDKPGGQPVVLTVAAAPGAAAAEQRLKEADDALERFADQVHRAREQGGSA